MTPDFAKKHDKNVEDKMQSLPSFVMAKNMLEEHTKTNKEHEEKKLAEKEKKIARSEAMNRLNEDKNIGLQNLVGNHNIFTPPKTSMHSTNLTLNENPSTIASSSSKGGNNDDSPFVPVQDCMLGMQKLVKQASTSLFMDLTEEADKPMDKKMKKLNEKLKRAKDAWRFAVDSKDMERADAKKRKVNELEDEIDELLESD